MLRNLIAQGFNGAILPVNPRGGRIFGHEAAPSLADLGEAPDVVVIGIGAHPLPLLLGYFLPLWIGYARAMAYIYTNHLLCPLTETNNPLANTLSLRVPRILDLLHLNFSHHVEHHIFPGLNSSYYPLVRTLLLKHYPDHYQLLAGSEAWRRLLSTPRHYRGATTLVNWNGDRTAPVLLAAPPDGPAAASMA